MHSTNMSLSQNDTGIHPLDCFERHAEYMQMTTCRYRSSDSCVICRCDVRSAIGLFAQFHKMEHDGTEPHRCHRRRKFRLDRPNKLNRRQHNSYQSSSPVGSPSRCRMPKVLRMICEQLEGYDKEQHGFSCSFQHGKIFTDDCSWPFRERREESRYYE